MEKHPQNEIDTGLAEGFCKGCFRIVTNSGVLDSIYNYGIAYLK